MNYYAFILIDNGEDFVGEIRDRFNEPLYKFTDRALFSDLPALAKKLELSKFHPDAVIHAVDAQLIKSAAVIETGAVKPIK